jgi:hypothetical protein
MKKYFISMIILFATTLYFISCKTTTEPVDTGTGEGEATISGQVLNNEDGTPIVGAEVDIIDGSNVVGKTTDSDGRFAAKLTISKSKDILVYTTLKGYYSDSTFVTVTANVESKVTIKLQKKTVGADVAGNPASIVLVSTSSQSIGVVATGSVETAYVTFEVQDSSGNAINIDHSVWVNFDLGQHPNGGEFISPKFQKTNAKGQVTVSISSGTKAGVLQFIAYIDFNGNRIISKPVNIAIHGGHPDQSHFSVGPKQLNIAGWDKIGVLDEVTALVGDKYGNPVKPKTAVYYTTSGGVIEGSALTNDLGLASVTLLSGNPLPVHPVLGNGFATITAITADENYNKVIDSTLVLFSGHSILTVSPTNFGNIPHGGSSPTIYYTINDINGNPIAPNNNVSIVVIEGGGVKVVGDVNFVTIDTQSKNDTHFAFQVVDTDIDFPLGARAISIQISVSGPNGKVVGSVSGTADF